MNKVFIYGQARQGFWNDFVLRYGQRLGTGETRERYAMYINTFPYVTRKKALTRITGDLYVVGDETLRNIDRLKGHPEWYCREKVPVVVDGKTHTAWLYFWANTCGTLVPSGDYFEELGRQKHEEREQHSDGGDPGGPARWDGLQPGGDARSDRLNAAAPDNQRTTGRR